jgi:hypothetical protein
MTNLTIDNDDAGLVAKIASDAWEINVRAAAEEFVALANIRSADWESRRSIKAGRSADAPVFWAFDGKSAWILVGSDDETWDFGVAVPVSIVDELVAEARSKG